jgi:hypothetical protein
VILLKQVILTGSLVFAVTAVSGCKSESAPKAPKKDQSLDSTDDQLNTEDDPAPGGLEGEDEGVPPSETVTSDPLSLEVSSEAALKVKVGTPVSITFNLKGADGKEVLVGLMSSPSGATVETSGTTVTYKWLTPTGGTYPVQFLLRDKAKCEEAESSASSCTISASDTSLTAKSYDVASDSFSLEVETDDNLGLPGTGAGLGGNDQLIQQITALLGGGNAGGIQDLLQGLGGGQLQGILGQLQNGGGGGGIGQLIGLLGG